MEENITARTEARRLPCAILNPSCFACVFLLRVAELGGEADPYGNHSGGTQGDQWPAEVIPLDPAQHSRCAIALETEKEPGGDITRRAERRDRAKLRPRHINLTVAERVAHNRGEIEAANP